ncbi:hypothetical protein [Metapseudomonas otitidis]|uniref:hypothetical protein n=1 Tax=Metapseudomonas otitidis TaxID=319939 RepID=UPI002449031E|nr:hypothetical protein [Pseudomonas otitidis]MDH0335130.1 hypothetical protein [Pseudomonas otitidis]
MTDRELLEAAARAAGIDPVLAQPIELSDGMHYYWNPIKFADDRYCLLKALKMAIDFDAQSVIYTLDGSICEESFRDDGDDARAVLRAAAEIGRNM